MAFADVLKFLSLGFTIVALGLILKNADKVNTIIGSYNNILGTLEKAA